MTITKDNLAKCFVEVKDLLNELRVPVSSAWIVGSAARIFDKKFTEQTSDVDIFIEGVRWNVSRLLDKSSIECYAPTGFGDWKVTLKSGLVVDFMFGHLGKYLRQVPTAWDGVAIHLVTKAKVTTTEYLAPLNFEIVSRITRRPNYLTYYYEHLRKQGIEVLEKE